MKQKKDSLKAILPAAAIAVPLFLSGINADRTDAAEKKSIYNLKLLIFNNGQYDSNYDANNDNKLDVMDIIRIKQDEYGLKETTVTTTTTEPETTVTTTTTTAPVTTTTVITTPPVTTAITTKPTTTKATTTTTKATTTTTKATTTTTKATTTTTKTTTAPPPVTTVTTTKPAPVTTPQKKVITNMKSMLQSPELPTGCEATGLTIAIRWYGYDVSKTDIALKYMPRQDFRYSGGRLIGADFRTTFAGDPSRNDMSYGCYIPCLQTTADNYFKSVGSSYRAKDITGTEFEKLLNYVANGQPVVVISTPELVTPRTGDSWYTEDGRYVTWQRGHHCMVIMGYDWSTYTVYCADPMMRKGIVGWNMTQFKTIYNLKGKNAMIIDTGNVTVPTRTASVGDTIRYAGFVNTQSDGKGSERYVDSNLYTVTNILPDTSLKCRVNIGNIGWVSYDALKENVAYFGNGTPSSGSGITNNGVYNIKNLMSGKYLNVDYGRDADGTNIYQWSRDGSTEQRFKLSAEQDAYKIYSMCSSSGSNRVVTASNTTDGANVHLYSRNNNTTQQWILKKVNDNAYTIALKAYPSYVLTAADGSNGSAGGTGTSSAGNVFISKYTGANSQLWSFE